MRQDFFDFTPTFKLFITGNHRPRLSTVDEAMRRRLLLVPFTVQIPPHERDQDLSRKLRPEWPAILRWMIDGCLEWQRIGLAPPACVSEATNKYFAAEDVFGQWITDECETPDDDNVWTTVGLLCEAWSSYATKGGDRPGTNVQFSQALAERGFRPLRRKVGRGFCGIRLTADASRRVANAL
jgi:putative DNA primase/helicase